MAADTGQVQGLVTQGRALYDQRRYDEAVTVLRQAALLDPQSAPALFALGLALVGRGDYAKAVSAFQMADRLQPDTPAIRYATATALLQSGKTDAARAVLGWLVEHDSGQYGQQARAILNGAAPAALKWSPASGVRQPPGTRPQTQAPAKPRPTADPVFQGSAYCCTRCNTMLTGAGSERCPVCNAALTTPVPSTVPVAVRVRSGAGTVARKVMRGFAFLGAAFGVLCVIGAMHTEARKRESARPMEEWNRQQVAVQPTSAPATTAPSVADHPVQQLDPREAAKQDDGILTLYLAGMQDPTSYGVARFMSAIQTEIELGHGYPQRRSVYIADYNALRQRHIYLRSIGR